MMPGLIAPEVQAWGDRNVLGFEKMPAEREGIAAELADISVQIERAFRLYSDTETQLPQGGQQEITTPAELGAALLENLDSGGFEASQCGVLGHARRAGGIAGQPDRNPPDPR